LRELKSENLVEEPTPPKQEKKKKKRIDPQIKEQLKKMLMISKKMQFQVGSNCVRANN